MEAPALFVLSVLVCFVHVQACGSSSKEPSRDAAEGERCGGWTGPVCEDGLTCVGKIQQVDGQGTCRRDATNCPSGILPVNCFANPCDVEKCGGQGSAADLLAQLAQVTCVPSYCGGCNAVFYDYDGTNVVNCTTRDKRRSTSGASNCYDQCIAEGKGGRECAARCKAISDSYAQLTYCVKENEEEYCKSKSGGLFKECHKILYVGSCVIDDVEQRGCYGVCIPKNQQCESNNECKGIGNIHSGLITGRCQNKKCKYENAIIMS